MLEWYPHTHTHSLSLSLSLSLPFSLSLSLPHWYQATWQFWVIKRTPIAGGFGYPTDWIWATSSNLMAWKHLNVKQAIQTGKLWSNGSSPLVTSRWYDPYFDLFSRSLGNWFLFRWNFTSNTKSSARRKAKSNDLWVI